MWQSSASPSVGVKPCFWLCRNPFRTHLHPSITTIALESFGKLEARGTPTSISDKLASARLASTSKHLSSGMDGPTKEEPELPRAEDIHLIACDVDGTLLTSKHELHPRTAAAIKHVRKTRPTLPIVISSGKQYVSCLHLRDELDLHEFPASHAHGSVIYGQKEEILFSNTLPRDVVLRLTAELRASNRATFLFTQSRCLYVNHEEGGKDWLSIANKFDGNVEDCVAQREELLKQVEDGSVDIIKVTVCADPESVEDYMVQLREGYPMLGLTRAIPFILELHDPHTNKGTALQFICKKHNISPRNCLVFGDGENDISMFREAGYSVAMGNGMQAAKAAATFVTETNDQGGVGAFLERLAF